MNKLLKKLENKETSLILCLLVVVYICFFSDKFPQLSNFFKNTYGKVISIIILVIIGNYSIPLALILSLVFVSKTIETLTMSTIDTSLIAEEGGLDYLLELQNKYNEKNSSLRSKQEKSFITV